MLWGGVEGVAWGWIGQVERGVLRAASKWGGGAGWRRGWEDESDARRWAVGGAVWRVREARGWGGLLRGHEGD